MKYLFSALLIAIAIGASTAQAEESPFKHTFAVVWNFTTSDRDLVQNNVSTQSAELLELWNQGLVENVYMDENAKFSDQKAMPNIMFFLQVDTEEEAAKILDEMTFVKKEIAAYKLFSVGLLWLKTQEEKQE